MSLLSGFNVTLPEVALLGEAALAAFAGGPVPAGWNVITPQQLGVSSQFWNGNYFTNQGASAIVRIKATLGSYRSVARTGRMTLRAIRNSWWGPTSTTSNRYSTP